MQVTALKNLIYDGTIRKTGTVFEMKDFDVARFDGRVATSQKAPELPALTELPPLDAPRKKK